MQKQSFEGIIASVFLIALFLVVLVQIFGRTPLFTGPVWTEETARWLWVWMAFIGIAAVEKNDAQLRMGFLAEKLRSGAQLVLYTLIDIAYAAIVGHLIWIGYKTVLRTSYNAAVTLPVSDAVLYASGAVAFVLILHRIVRRIFTRLRNGPTDPDSEVVL